MTGSGEATLRGRRMSLRQGPVSQQEHQVRVGSVPRPRHERSESALLRTDDVGSSSSPSGADDIRQRVDADANAREVEKGRGEAPPS